MMVLSWSQRNPKIPFVLWDLLNWDYSFLVERNLRSFYVKEYRLFILVFQDVADFVGLGFTVSAKLIPKLSLLGPELQLWYFLPLSGSWSIFVVDTTIETFEYCVFCKKELLCLSVIISWNIDPSFLLHQLEINSKPSVFQNWFKW